MDSSSDLEEEACLSLHAQNADQKNQSSLLASFCPPVFDRFICWGPASPKMLSSQPCPSIKGSDSSHEAFRICGETGRWLGKDGLPSDTGWTNYTPCFTPEIREIMRQLGTTDEAQTKLNIAVNTRILELIGLSLSLTALILSLVIFYKFRTLRNSRTRLHRHLFIAMGIQVTIRLILYIDQAITRANSPQNNPKPLGEENLRGIDNTPILCEAGYICLEYARTAMFMWMFVEGLYLHNMITVTVFEEKLSPLIYSIVGWVLPIPLTIAWTIVTALNYGTATCWWGYNFTLYFWILEGPRLGVLVVNLAFLLNILRVLVTKLRRSNSSETHQARKAVKAALLLLPLLGLTNLLNMLHAPLDKSAWVFGLWSYSTHLLTSCQGVILSILYCFNNGEVQSALRKYFQTKILGRNKVRLPRTSVRMSLLNNTVVANVDARLESPIPGTGIGIDCKSLASNKSNTASPSTNSNIFKPRQADCPSPDDRFHGFQRFLCFAKKERNSERRAQQQSFLHTGLLNGRAEFQRNFVVDHRNSNSINVINANANTEIHRPECETDVKRVIITLNVSTSCV